MPNYEAFEQAQEVLGEDGVVVVTGAANWKHRTPQIS